MNNKEQCSLCSLDSNNRVEAVLLSGPYGKVAAAGHRIQIRDTGNGGADNFSPAIHREHAIIASTELEIDERT
jgi:hypothetical protein